MRELASDASELAKNEVLLAKLELQDTLKRAAIRATGAVMGALVALFGLGLLCMTAVVGLEPLIEPLWLRMLLMSAVYLLIGGAVCMAFLARVRNSELGAPAAVKQARETVAAIKNELRHE